MVRPTARLTSPDPSANPLTVSCDGGHCLVAANDEVGGLDSGTSHLNGRRASTSGTVLPERLTLADSITLVFVIEAAENLGNPLWLPVATNTLTGGSCYFSDPGWTNSPTRFYRLRSP